MVNDAFVCLSACYTVVCVHRLSVLLHVCIVPSFKIEMKENGRGPFSEWRFPPVRIPAAFCNAGRLFVSQSVSQIVCSSISVNSSGSAKPIRTGPTPKDAPKRQNDDGVGHVAPRVTCDPPRAAA